MLILEVCAHWLAYTKGRKPIHDQLSVLGTDILNICRNNDHGGSFQRFTSFRLSPKYQLGQLWCSWEVQLCNTISLVNQVYKYWLAKPEKWDVLVLLLWLLFECLKTGSVGVLNFVKVFGGWHSLRKGGPK